MKLPVDVRVCWSTCQVHQKLLLVVLVFFTGLKDESYVASRYSGSELMAAHCSKCAFMLTSKIVINNGVFRSSQSSASPVSSRYFCPPSKQSPSLRRPSLARALMPPSRRCSLLSHAMFRTTARSRLTSLVVRESQEVVVESVVGYILDFFCGIFNSS